MSESESAPRWRDACPVCGSARLATMTRYRRAHLVHCHDCAMVFSARVPTEAELQAHYEDYGHAWRDSPITRQRYAELLGSFAPYRSTNRILDFGCGAGYFLEEAAKKGWQAYGTEYSARALKLARSKGLEVEAAPITTQTFEPGFFDVVTAFEVFEHVHDLRGEADLLAGLIRPGGLLYCTTPNFNSLSRRIVGPDWSVIEYPEHLCYFTPSSLRRWLSQHGLEAESLTSTGISFARLRAAAGASEAGGQVAAGDEQLREVVERSAALKLAKTLANGVLGAFELGDTLKARFRRAEARRGAPPRQRS